MEIRFTNVNENMGVKDLWTYCFADSKAYVDFYFKNKYKPEKTLVVEDSGRILSAIHLNQHELSLYGKNLDTSYIVGVSTLAEARGMGFMSDLMTRSLYEIAYMGQSFCILMPIDHRLYRSYGFENSYDMLEIDLNIFDLKKFKLEGTFKRANEEYVDDVLDIYLSSTANYNGFALRNKVYFSDFIEEMELEGGYIYILYRDGQPRGYIAYSIDDGSLFVREIYYKDMISYQSILKFIFNHNTQCKRVKINTSIDDRLMDILDNPKDASFMIKPFMMARIVDVENFLNDTAIKSDFSDDSSYNDDKQSDFGINIEIIDPVIKENNGIYRFGYESARLRARKLDKFNPYDSHILASEGNEVKEDIEEEPIADICLSINELTSLLFGYRTIEDICFVKGIGVSKNLKEIFNFKKKTNYINEYV